MAGPASRTSKRARETPLERLFFDQESLTFAPFYARDTI
jgi:hypothetical protein